MEKRKKIRSISATMKYNGHLEDFLAAPKSQTTFFTPTINHCYDFKEGLEILTSSTPTKNYCHSLKEGLETLISSISTNNYYCNFKKKLKILISSIPTNNYCHSF